MKYRKHIIWTIIGAFFFFVGWQVKLRNLDEDLMRSLGGTFMAFGLLIFSIIILSWVSNIIRRNRDE